MQRSLFGAFVLVVGAWLLIARKFKVGLVRSIAAFAYKALMVSIVLGDVLY